MSDPLNVLDLRNPPPGHEYKATIEPQETVADRYVRLFKDIVLFIVAVGFVLLLVWTCVGAILSPATQPEEKKWAMSVLPGAAGGIIGYLVRK